MAVTARTWVEGELVNATKMNTLRDDILELDAVAGFEDTQFGTITLTGTNATGDATVSAMSARAAVILMGMITSTASVTIGGGYLTKINATTVRFTRGNATGDLGGGAVLASFCIFDPRG